MCGFGVDMLFKVAIFIVIVIAIFAMLRWAFPTLFNIDATAYGPLLRIVIGAVVAIVVLAIVWKLAECSGLLHAGYKPLFSERGA